VWLPLNDVTTSNGCMYAVPRSKDPAFEPLATSEEGGEGGDLGEGVQEPVVPAGSLVALAPHPKGSFMCWSGNTIHWGSSCGKDGAHDPRTSLAFVFRLKGHELSVQEKSLTKSFIAEATTAQRLEWVLQALRFFSHWYPEADLARLPLPVAGV
jgi:hypothetical protein